MRSRPPWRCTASSPHGPSDAIGSGLRYLRRRQRSDGAIRYSSSSQQTPVWVTAQALPPLRRKPFSLDPLPSRSCGARPGPIKRPARTERVSGFGTHCGGRSTRTAGAAARGRSRARADVRARAATRAAKGGVSEGLNHSDLPSADVPHATWRIRRSPARACRPVRAAPPAHGAPSPTRAPNRSPRFALRGPKAEARRRPRPRCAPAAHPLAASPSPSSPRSPGAARTRRLWATIRRRSP